MYEEVSRDKIVMDEPEWRALIQNDSGYLFNDYANNLEKAMNMMAKRGWRLISVYSVEAAYFAVFEKIARAIIAGAIAGGLGHSFVFSKKRWEEEKKFKIASTMMGIMCPIASLLFGYLIMFDSIAGRYFTILFPIDIFFIFLLHCRHLCSRLHAEEGAKELKKL